MRIATSTIFNLGTSGIQSQQSQLATLEAEISSGTSLNVASDNPLGAAQAVGLQQASDLNTQYAANQSSVTSTLNLSSQTLGSIQSTISAIQQLVVKAGDPSLTDAERSVIATQLQSDQTTLVGLGNTTDSQGNYIYGGYDSTTPPFTTAPDGSVVYNGDSGQSQVQVSANNSVAASDPGSSIFGGVAPGTNTGIAYASSSNTGTATFGAVSVTNSASPSNADTFQITFAVGSSGTTTYTVQDLTTNQAVPAGSTTPQTYTSGTAINLGGQTITLTGAPATGDSFTVRPPQSAGSTIVATPSSANAGTATASAVVASNPQTLSSYHNYSIAYSTTGNQFVVTDSSTTPNTTYNVPLGSGSPASTTIPLGAGQSVAVSGTPANGDTFTVTPPTTLGQASTATTTSATATIGAVTTSSPADASNYHAYSVAYSSANTAYTVTDSSTTPPTVITVPLGTGTPPSTTLPLGNDQSVTISGTPANGDTFAVQPKNVGTNLFTTISNVIAALKQPGSGTSNGAALTNVLATASAQLANSLSNVLNVQATVGARVQTLTAVQTDNTSAALQLQTNLSNLTSTNVVQAYTQFEQLSVSLQAAEKTFVQVQSLSLFSIIQ